MFVMLFDRLWSGLTLLSSAELGDCAFDCASREPCQAAVERAQSQAFAWSIHLVGETGTVVTTQ
jgi:hypothetical protein